jgi:DNA-binding NarL/FixJ family response regulator
VVELPLAIKAVMAGETYLTPKVSRYVVDGFLHEEASDRDPIEGLPPRQREILQLIAEGRGTKEIAGILNVSVKTIETHRARLMERLDIHDVPGLVRFAIRSGLVSPES